MNKIVLGEAHAGCPFHAQSLNADNVFKRWDLVRDGYPKMAGESGGGLTLTEAARQAWRHSARCVGRMHWRSLKVVDARGVGSCDEMFEALCEQVREGTGEGRVRSTMTVFGRWEGERTEVRIWSHQLARYAGYAGEGGKVEGDPANVGMTRLLMDLGWSPPSQPGRFDLLPVLLQHGSELKWYEWPEGLIREVRLRHSRYSWFEDLGLRWYAVPFLSDMILATGVEAYPAAPFNGWYMGTEIGARNLGDAGRYNLLPVIAEKLGLRSSGTRNLWRDHALLVLNEAVLESFEADGVRLVDHHRAAEEFERFCRAEEAGGRQVSADWSWIVPPLAGSTTAAFHRELSVKPQMPNLLLQEAPWQTARGRKILEQAVQGKAGRRLG